MINCFIYFEDILLAGKVSSLVQRINPDIEIFSILDKDQLKTRSSADANNLLVTEYQLYKDATEGDLGNGTFHTIVLSEGGEDPEGIMPEGTPLIDQKRIVTTLATYIDDFVSSSIKKDSYVPVEIKKLKEETAYPVDFYVKLSESKFVKVQNANDELDRTKLDKYRDKDIYFLYIAHSDYNDFANFQYQRKTLIKKRMQFYPGECGRSASFIC